MAQEEMDRASGFWWSPDGTRLAYTEVDETTIPVYPIVHQGRRPGSRVSPLPVRRRAERARPPRGRPGRRW